MNEKCKLNPTGMFSRVELIGPERAQALLASQVNPRKPDKKRVARYCSARINGEWTLHHQGIGLNCHERMIDGQHRMLMVVSTKLPTAFYVTYNVPHDGTLHVDEQLPRTVQVALRAAGAGEFSNAVIAVARVIETLPAHAMGLFSKNEMIALLTRHAKALGFAEAHATRPGLFTASARCLIARAAYSVDCNRLKHFCDVVKTGVPSDVRADLGAIRFRNVLLDLKGSGGHAREVERYRKGQTALQAFLRMEPIAKLYGTDQDLFPLPAPDSVEFERAV